MESRIAKELKLKYHPLAAFQAESIPEGAVHFEAGKWGCVISLYFLAAAKGKLVAFDADHHGCMGGGTGVGVKGRLSEPPGGLDHFLSCGAGPGYREGEGYIRTPELARQFLSELPLVDPPLRCVVAKPLSQLEDGEAPLLVTVFATPDQISALSILAMYTLERQDAVAVPFGAGCHSVFLFPYHEAQLERPQAVLGCLDISARPHLPADVFSFTVPWAVWQRMEAAVPGSFLERAAWSELSPRIPAV